jgi:XisH protein
MSANDKFHEEVKRALIKDQWTVTDDPFKLESEEQNFEIDFGAERLILAERGVEKIAIEVKSFLNSSAITDFYGALGQFATYRLALKREDPERTLYLAVPEEVYEVFFKSPFIQVAIDEFKLLLIVYEPREEVIVRWIK